ncbi:hypothetical protein GT039_06440 [Streptomyces sp. SID2955]|nr:hypothetical protein [Streptomyces sp. SID2955]
MHGLREGPAPALGPRSRPGDPPDPHDHGDDGNRPEDPHLSPPLPEGPLFTGTAADPDGDAGTDMFTPWAPESSADDKERTPWETGEDDEAGN